MADEKSGLMFPQGATVVVGLILLAGLFAMTACSDGEDTPALDLHPALEDSIKGLAWSPIAAEGPRLNLLLLSLDTTRADRLSCYGFSQQTTPNLDQLARSGILFEEAFSSVPITLPAHASMHTGLYPYQHGVRTNGIYALGEDKVTLAEMLRKRGYDTGAVLGAFPVDSRFGLAQGFSHYDDKFVVEGGLNVEQAPERSGSEVTRLALHWLDRDRDKPFFLWCHYFDPHAPYAPPEPHRSRFGNSAYCGEIATMDAAIGDLLDGLKSRGVMERTIVVVVGDHGESLGEHDEQTHAFYIYDATLRVPMIWRFPQTGPFHDPLWRGRHLPGLVNLTDLFPTAWNALGFASEDRPAMAGHSLLPMIQGESDGHPWLYHESLVPQLDFGASDLRGLRMGSWKYISAPRPELYDLQADPGEMVNLADKQPDRVQLMEERMKGILPDQEILVAKRTPDPDTITRLRSLGYVAGGQSTGGSRASRFDPKDLGGFAEASERAFVYSREDREQEALTLVDSLLAVFSEPVFVHQLRGRLLLALARPEDAIMSFDEAIARCGDCPHMPDLLLQKAMATFAAGQTNDALAQAEALVAQGGQKYGLRLFLSDIWESKGDWARARQALREEADLWPDHSLPLLQLGELEKRAGRPEAAEKAFREILSTTPKNIDALVALNELLAESGREAEAAALVAQALTIDPSHPRANLRRGIELQQDGHDEEAVRCFEIAIRNDPTDPMAQTFLGTALVRLGRREEGLPPLESAIATGLAMQEAYTNLGVVYYQLGRFDDAIAIWQEGFRRDPEGPFAEQLSTYVRQARQRLKSNEANQK